MRGERRTRTVLFLNTYADLHVVVKHIFFVMHPIVRVICQHAYLSSPGCQLLPQGFQFLLLNKQLLIVSLSQRLQGNNPLKTILHVMQK